MNKFAILNVSATFVAFISTRGPADYIRLLFTWYGKYNPQTL